MQNEDVTISERTTILGAIEARGWAQSFYGSGVSPFLPQSLIGRIKAKIIVFLLTITKQLLKQELYVENQLGGLSVIDISSLRLLRTLRNKKIVTRWWLRENTVNGPRMFVCGLEMGKVEVVNGKKYDPRSTAAGAGLTPNEAMVPALGECIERHALYVWNEKSLVHSTAIMTRNCVPPQSFLLYSDEQLADSYFKRSLITDDTLIRWVPARALSTGKRYLVPAQTVYLPFDQVYPEEPVFEHTTSNGAAAATTYEDACVRALSEMVERDAFMVHWFNMIAPLRIDLTSLPASHLRLPLREFAMWGYRLELLDITTDITVPTLCGVLIDEKRRNVIAVCTATSFNVLHAINKVLFDLARWTRVPHKHKLEPFTEPKEMIKIFKDRERYWSREDNLGMIMWLLSGKLVTYNDVHSRYVQQEAMVTVVQKLDYFKRLFQRCGHECYFVDVTTDIAKQSGLRVVKALTPGLVPIYFDERKKPLRVQRLYTAPITMRVATRERTVAQMNDVPHPFI